jgi:hypothetical protein
MNGAISLTNATCNLGLRLCADTGLSSDAKLRSVEAGRAGLQGELGRLLTSQAAYRHAGQVMEVWHRQVGLDQLPANLLPVVLLHCHLTNQLAPTMKVS